METTKELPVLGIKLGDFYSVYMYPTFFGFTGKHVNYHKPGIFTVDFTRTKKYQLYL